MFRSDAWVPVWVGLFFVAIFIALQVMSWRGSSIAVGGTRRFARFALATSVMSIVVVTLAVLSPGLQWQFLRGLPFIAVYTLAILSSFLVPALGTIEVILVAESLLTTKIEPGAGSWHVASLSACVGWVGIMMSRLVMAP